MSHDQSWSAGQVLTAAALNDLTSGTVNYVTVTSNQGSITSIADLTSLTITFTAIASRRYLIKAIVHLSSDAANDIARVSITDGSNTVLQIGQVEADTVSTAYTVAPWVIVAPGAGSVTYKLRAQRVSGSGNVTSNASATLPAAITVQDAGST